MFMKRYIQIKLYYCGVLRFTVLGVQELEASLRERIGKTLIFKKIFQEGLFNPFRQKN